MKARNNANFIIAYTSNSDNYCSVTLRYQILGFISIPEGIVFKHREVIFTEFYLNIKIQVFNWFVSQQNYPNKLKKRYSEAQVISTKSQLTFVTKYITDKYFVQNKQSHQCSCMKIKNKIVI